MAYSPTRTGVACAIFPMSSSACIIFFTLAARGWVDFFVFILELDNVLSVVTSDRGSQNKYLGGGREEASFSSRRNSKFRPSSGFLMLSDFSQRVNFKASCSRTSAGSTALQDRWQLPTMRKVDILSGQDPLHSATYVNIASDQPGVAGRDVM